MDYHISTFWAVAIGVLAVWELTLKGFALWRAARRDQLGWYLAILVINTVGVLPIVYLLYTNKEAQK